MNTFQIHPFAIPSVQSVKPYFYNQRFYSTDKYIKLSDNENPYGGEYTRYPDPVAYVLRQSYCQYLNQENLNPKNILFCNGSTEAIDLTIRSFCRPGKDKICITSPTFGLFKHWANGYGIDVIDIPLLGNNFDQLNTEDILITPSKLLFLCNPTNPVGSLLNTPQIINILENYNGIVAVDECYIEFSNTISCIELLKNFPNLIIIRTLSKAWGMAGLRAGIVIASEKIINTLECIKSPFSFSKPAQDYTELALKNIDELKKQWDLIIAERDKLYNEIQLISCIEYIYKSYTNFLLIKFYDANKVPKKLLENKIIVRDFTHVLDNCLRISIGDHKQNSFLIQVLQNAC